MNNLKVKDAYAVLEKQGIISPQTDTIVKNAKELFDRVPNIQNSIVSNVGLIVGKVQSGKTSVMIASSALAFENGHKTVIAILSDTDILLTQNYERIKDTFSIIKDVHVFKESKDGDFKGIKKDELSYLYKKGQKIFICCLKRTDRINKVIDKLRGTGYEDDFTLIFDDEGDDISQNNISPKKKFGFDQDGKPAEVRFSSTNKAIRLFKKGFSKASYISVTATSESIIMLQDIQHLSPDFVLTTPPGTGYCGLQYFHADCRDRLIQVIEDNPIGVNEENGIPDGLKNAIAHFFAGCIFRKRKEKSLFKHSMMIHTSRINNDHKAVTNKICTYIAQIKDGIKFKRYVATSFLERVNIELTDISNEAKKVSYDELNEVLNDLKISSVNGLSENKNIKSMMSIMPFHIIIGGDLLDRGVTIDNLAVVYIVRDSKIAQMDTLLQRARWFGYKMEYIETCKVYLTQNLDEKFLEMVPVEQSIWDMLEVCSDKRIPPREYDFELEMDTKKIIPTSKNKASYENVLVGLRTEQKYVMLNKKYNDENLSLINIWKKCHSSDLLYKKYGGLIHKYMVLPLSEVLSILKNFRFSSEDRLCNYESFSLTLEHLKYQDSDLVDVIFMQRGDKDYEERSTVRPNTNEIVALLQGHSVAKNSDDPEYYKGDRYIVGNRPMLQIHNVVLKNDVVAIKNGEVKLHKGDKTIMLAWLFPEKDYLKMIVKRKNLLSN